MADSTAAGAWQPETYINCDQVAWVKDALQRLSRTARDGRSNAFSIAGAEAACLTEIMHVLRVQFADQSAAFNAIHSQTIRDAFLPVVFPHGQGAISPNSTKEPQ